MKERQRWQPEEDSLLRDYVDKFGAKDWGKVSERTGRALDRDAKSCMERWKNYLKPGIKKTPLTPEEKVLVINLQEKYGNKWKKIASEVPGRTAKRLGKWWEVHKERERKEREREWGAPTGEESATNPNYSELFKHIAEKLDQRQGGSSSSSVPALPSLPLHHPFAPPASSLLLKGSTMAADPYSAQGLYLTQHQPLSIGPTSSSSSMGTTSVPVADSFDFKLDDARLHEAASTTHTQTPMAATQVLPPFSLASRHSQLRSKETSSLPLWMSTLPSTSATGKLCPISGAIRETCNVAKSRVHSDYHGDRSRHPSVGLSLASPPSPTIGVGPSSPKWSHDTDVGTNTTRSSGVEEAATGQRASWYHNQTTVGGTASVSGGIVDEVRMHNPTPKNLEDFIAYWKDLDEKSKIWPFQRKEESWKLKRFRREMVEEKIARSRKKAEEFDSRLQILRTEQRKFLEDLELEYWEKMEAMEREVETEDRRKFDEWIGNQQVIIQEQKKFLHEWSRRSAGV